MIDFCRVSLAGCCVLLLVAAAGVVHGGQDAPATEDAAPPAIDRPAYEKLRFNEDWSALRGHDTTATGNPFDPIKFIPLNEDGSWYASFGGHARLRVESWNNFNFDDANDDTFLLGRVFLHGDFHFGEYFRIFVEGKTAHVVDRNLPGGRRTTDVDSIDLHNAFADLRLPLNHNATLTIRGGRQELLFGRERLVSPLDWANVRRSHDGVSLIYEQGDWTITGFWTQTVIVDKYSFNKSDSDEQFFGVYAQGKVPNTAIGLDLYLLSLFRDGVTFNATTGNEERYTLGGRVHGKLMDTGFDYELEGAYQTGSVGSGDVDAFFVSTQVGYRFEQVNATPRIFLGFDYASGDRAPGGDVQTFNQLYPLGHAYLGWIDLIGRQNIIALNPGVSFHPTQRLTLNVHGHFFWRAQTSDAVYNAGGAVLRPAGASEARYVGAELDLLVNYRFNQHLTGMVGYSRFFTGSFIRETGPSRDVDFVYAALQFTF